jgi:hypothetical protein
MERSPLEARAVGLDPGVLPRAAGFDVTGAGLGETAPVPKDVGRQLRTVVHADKAGEGSPLGGDPIEVSHRGIGVDGVGDEVGERLAGELVGDVQDLDRPPKAGDSNW